MLTNNFVLRFLTFGILFFSMACSHSLHQYHVSDVELLTRKASAKRISSDAEQFVVMGFTTETEYVNRAFDSLKNQCSNGSVTGIHTRYSTSHGFLSWTNKIKMTAMCVR